MLLKPDSDDGISRLLIEQHDIDNYFRNNIELRISAFIIKQSLGDMMNCSFEGIFPLFSRTSLTAIYLVAGLLLAGCSNNDEEGVSTSAGKVTVSAVDPDPCSLLDHAEAESLAGMKLIPGEVDTRQPNQDVRTCVWKKPIGSPAVLLLYWPNTDKPLNNWALSGYEVKKLHGLSGEAIAVIQKAKPEFGVKRGLAMVVIRSNSGVMTLSAPYLHADDGSAAFDNAIHIASIAAAKAP